MSTSVSSVGTGYQTYQSSWQTNRQKGQQDFQALATALNSNDLSGAQTAFAALQKDVPGLSGSQQNSQTGNSNNPLTSDFQNLSQALSSGDLSSAQSAFAKLQQDLQTLVGGHRHRHHHGGGGGIAAALAAVSSSNTGTTTDSSADPNGSSSQTTLDIQA